MRIKIYPAYYGTNSVRRKCRLDSKAHKFFGKECVCELENETTMYLRKPVIDDEDRIHISKTGLLGLPISNKIEKAEYILKKTEDSEVFKVNLLTISI